MKRKTSIISFFSFLVSLIAAGMFICLLGDGFGFFLYPWVVLGSVSMLCPIIAKFFRTRACSKGRGFEIAALVIGFYDFYWILAVKTEINSTVIFFICVGICVIYSRLFNKQTKRHVTNNGVNGGVTNMKDNDIIENMIKVQAEETFKAYNANKDSQPNNENDEDFGLIPEKPVFTLAKKSIDGEEEYLNKLYTENGVKVKWNRRGSKYDQSSRQMIDIYDTFLPNGEFYKTIYINMYGVSASQKAPSGFTFTKPSSREEKVVASVAHADTTQASNLLQAACTVPEKNIEEKIVYQYIPRKKTGFIITLIIFILTVIISGVVIVAAVLEIESTGDLYNEYRNKYIDISNRYDDLVDKYNSLVDDYNALIDYKKADEAFETLCYSGKGSKTIKGINAPEGIYYITFKYTGDEHMVANLYTDITNDNKFVNLAGTWDPCENTESYSGYIDNGYINISTSGNGGWEITIEKVR